MGLSKFYFTGNNSIFKRKCIKGKGLEMTINRFFKWKDSPLVSIRVLPRAKSLPLHSTDSWVTSLHLTKGHDGRHQDQLPRGSCGWCFCWVILLGKVIPLVVRLLNVI